MNYTYKKILTHSTFFVFVYQNIFSDVLKYIKKSPFFNFISVSYEEIFCYNVAVFV